MKQRSFTATIRFLVDDKGIFQSISEAAKYLDAFTSDKFPPTCDSTNVYWEENKTYEHQSDTAFMVAFCSLFIGFGLSAIIALLNDNGFWANSHPFILGLEVSFVSFYVSAIKTTRYEARTLEFKYTFDAPHTAEAILWTQKTQSSITAFWKQNANQIHGISYHQHNYTVK